jgi:hypothetical protein
MLAAFAEIAEFFALLAVLVPEALVFSRDAFVHVANSGEAQSAAIVVAFLAGVSELLGQSVILVVNRIPLYRFLASLGFTGLTYALTVVTWGLAALAVAPLTPVGALSLSDFAPVTGVLALAFAPRLLGVFSLAPYFGAALGNALEVWSMALAMFGLYVGVDLPMGAAMFCGGAGFLASYLFRSFLGHLFAKPLGRLRHAVSGSAMDRTPQQIIDDLMARIADEREP